MFFCCGAPGDVASSPVLELTRLDHSIEFVVTKLPRELEAEQDDSANTEGSTCGPLSNSEESCGSGIDPPALDDVAMTVCPAEAEIETVPRQVHAPEASQVPVQHSLAPGFEDADPQAMHAQTVIDACVTVPFPQVPQGLRPIMSQKLRGATVETVQLALDAVFGPFEEFMRDVLDCSDFHGTPWVADTRVDKKCLVRMSRYNARPPADMPNVVKRLMGVPDTMRAHSLYAVTFSEDQIILVQHSFIQDVLYSDRFHLQNTFSIVRDGKSCRLSQWTEVIWTNPLPWTHSLAKLFIDKKAKSEAKASFADFVRVLELRA